MVCAGVWCGGVRWFMVVYGVVHTHTVRGTSRMKCNLVAKRDSSSSSSSSSSEDEDKMAKRAVVHGDDDLFSDKLISQDLENAPKEEIFRLLRLKGHVPMQRNIRNGNIQVVCKACNGKCSTSTYRRDAWYATLVTPELGKQCGLATPALETKREPKRMWCVVVYGGVWWCTCSIVTRL